MLDLCFCVVLYNKKLSDSETLISLSKNLHHLELDYKVIVFNNGPDEVSSDGFPVCSNIHQVLINGSLSKIYNKTIYLYQAKKYIFLDDDTHVSSEYLKELSGREFKVFFPKIVCNDIQHYPAFIDNGVQTITSGLAISHSAIEDIISINGFVFDEAFDLYGIDTAFCYFINQHSFPYVVADSSLNHQLSHVSGSSGEFRKEEVLLANSAALIRYFNLRLLLQILASAFWAVRFGKISLLFKAFVSFISKKVVR